jgi:hypothetical protein
MRVKELSAIALATAATAAAPGVASAAPPERVPVPAEPIAFDAGQVCDFPISFDPVQQGEKIAFFADGRARLTGVSKAVVTNLDNGRSILVNASGPSWLDRNVGEGHNLFVLFPEDAGGPGIFLVRGQVTFTRDEDASSRASRTPGAAAGTSAPRSPEASRPACCRARLRDPPSCRRRTSGARGRRSSGRRPCAARA